ncbi:MAG: hypothetical protein AAGE52_35135 [Myxococcota bacterium]
MRWIAIALVASSASLAAAQNERGIYDREFTIGPRVGVISWADDNVENNTGIAVGADLRKELGPLAIRLIAELHYAFDTKDGGFGLDFGPAFFLTRGAIAPWIGFDFGLRFLHNSGSNWYSVAPGAYLAAGIAFRRDQRHRFYIDVHVGTAYTFFVQQSLSDFLPDAPENGVLLTEGRVSFGVGF